MPSIVIAQGGGPTAVINQTLCGAIPCRASRHDPSVRILGARYGVRGLCVPKIRFCIAQTLTINSRGQLSVQFSTPASVTRNVSSV
jgi:6-phosphofructokinase